MEKPNQRLGTAPVGTLLKELAIPCVTAQVINALYNIVDRIYIGHLPGSGSLALAGLGVCFPLIMVISAFAGLVGFGGAPRASIAMGAGEKERAERILGTCFTSSAGLALILMGVFFAFGKQLLLLFGATEANLPYALSYLNCYLLGTLSVQITLCMNAFITAQGFTKVSMKTTVIGAVVNLILDPVFIFGLGMGVRGAALASALAQTVSAVWVLRFLTGKSTTLSLRRENLRPDLRILGVVLALGVSPFVMQCTESAVQSCFNIQVRAYGGAQADVLIGGTSIMLSVLQFATLPVMGICQGGQPITGFNYGAGRYGRVKESFFLQLKCVAAYMITFVALSVLFPGMVGRIFTSDEAVLDVVRTYLPRFICGMSLCFLLFVCQQTFLALGQAPRSLAIACLRKLILLIPLMFLLPHFFGLSGIYLSEPLADVIASVTAAIVFYRFSRGIFSASNGHTEA